MKTININLKSKINQPITLFLDNKELGILTNKMEVELTENSKTIYAKYGDKKSNAFPIKILGKNDFNIDVIQTSDMIGSSMWHVLRILFFLFLTSFCIHKAIGIGYYVFSLGLIGITVMFALKWKNIIIRKAS